MQRPDVSQPIGGLWRDSIKPMQPKGTWPYALNAQIESFDATGFGVVNEPSNEICFDLGEDWLVLNGAYIEDRDEFLFFARKRDENRSIIGTASTIKCNTRILVDDKDWEEKLCFSKYDFIPVETKLMTQPCNHMMAYFSAGDWYYRLDLDGDLCNLTRDDLLLLRCVCAPIPSTAVIPEGGAGLAAGAYQFVLQLIDEDNNTTNWFSFSNPVYLNGPKFQAGEPTSQVIELNADGISDNRWGRVNIGVVRTIRGQKNFYVLDTVPYTTNGFTYRYVGSENEEARNLTEVFARQDRYIRGQNLAQKDGRLILFELKNMWNLDYQKEAMGIESEYLVYKVKPEEASDYPTLMRDEVYSIGIKWNYCDGTSSGVFHIPGRTKTEFDKEIIPAEENCTDCDLQRWQVENTAARVETYCEESYALSLRSSTSQNIVQDSKVEYIPVEVSEIENCCGRILEPCGELCPEKDCGGGGCNGGCDDGSCGDDPSNNCATGDNGSVCYTCEGGFNFSGYDGYDVNVTIISDGLELGKTPVETFQGNFLHGDGWYMADTLRMVITDSSGTVVDTLTISYDCGETTQGSCSGGGCGGGTGTSSSSSQCSEQGCLSCGTLAKGFLCQDSDGNEFFESDPNGNWYKRQKLAPITKAGTGNEIAAAASNNLGCDPEPIYDESGCYITGYTKPLVARGNMAYWESEDTYPTTRNCDGQPIFGMWAGLPIRHHKTPSELTEPHFISTQTGVPNPDDPANEIGADTFVYILGLRLKNIVPPKNTPKPLCEENPYDIVYQKRDGKNKSVIGKGLFTGTFRGQVGDRQFLVPNNGVNSLEKFDGHLETESTVRLGRADNPSKKHRGGWNAKDFDVVAYNFHSPETNFDRPPLDATKAYVSWELYGQGYRYGLYADGKDVENELLRGKNNQRGTRQWVNLNHYKCASGNGYDPCCIIANVRLEQQTGWLEGERVRTSPFGLNISFGLGQLQGTYTLKTELGVQTVGEKTGQIPSSGVLYETDWFKDILDPFTAQLEYQDIVTTTLTIDATSFYGCRYSGAARIQTIVEEDGDFFTVIEQISSPDCDPVQNDDCRLIQRCIKGISYAEEDSIVRKGDEFTYPLLNLKREDSVYVEFEEPELLRLSEQGALIDPFLNDNRYNGLPDDPAALLANGTSDGSFLGDVYIHDCHIHKAGGWYGSLKRENRKQYGRLESAPYITLYRGTKKELLCGTADLCGVGDTWISQYSMVRHSLVSDKIGGREQQRNKSGFASEVFCDYKCGDVPESGDKNDPRNRVRFRGFDGSGNEDDGTVGNRCWDGEQNFNGLIGRDTYRPNLLKTQITFWVESTIKTDMRQRGEESACEIAYPNLGEYELDAGFPTQYDWRETLLAGCHYVEQNEAAGWKLFAKILFAILAVGPGFLSTIINGSNFICDFIDWLLNIDECAVRCLDGDQDCIVDTGKIRGTPKNYHKYNWDFSELNTVEVFYGLPDPYDTCICEDRSNRIRHSDAQNIESAVDAYQNFRVNSYTEFPAEFGAIKNFFHVGNRMFAHTTDMILDLRTDYETLQSTSGESILLGRAGFLQRATPIQGGLLEGYAGTLDPHSAINTAVGYFFVDREARAVYLFGGAGVEEISAYGMKGFFKENLDLKILKHFPNYDAIDFGNVGYKMGYDHRFDRLLLTKEDYEPKEGWILEYIGDEFFSARKEGTKDTPKNTTRVKIGDPKYFCNRSFTLSYNPKMKRWISFHSYIPRGYVWNRDHTFSFVDGGLWKHGDNRESYQTFYGRYYPHVLETISYDAQSRWKTYTFTEFETESRKWVNCQYVENTGVTFNKALFYNSNQSSGLLNLVQKDRYNQLEGMMEKKNSINLERTEKRWKVNGFKNRAIDPSVPLFECNCDEPSVLSIPNEGNIATDSRQGGTEDLRDEYLGSIFVLDNPDDSSTELVTRFIMNWNDVR